MPEKEKKTILVTGGSSGIGLSIASLLVSAGDAQLVSVSRSREKVQRALKAHPELEKKVDFYLGDLSRPADCRALYAYLEKKYGSLHALVNNAAILSKGSMEEMSYARWKETLDVNLNAPFLLTKTLLPLLKKAKGGSIVNISSIAGQKPGTSVSYSVSKAGLDMLTLFLAGDLGPYGIRVNAISPGLVQTPIHLDNRVVKTESAYQQMLEGAVERYPLGRIGQPVDVAALAVFLLSDQASWISGAVIRVDGGCSVYNDLIPPKDPIRNG